MDPDLVIREACIEDAPSLNIFFNQLFAESLDVMGKRYHATTIKSEIDRIIRIEAEENSYLFLAFKNDSLVGTLDLCGYQHLQKRHVAELRLAVGRWFRGQGIGRALIESAVHQVQSDHYLTRIELEVFEINKPAIQLYKKMQFQVEGIKREAVQVEGKCIDVLSMALLLHEYNQYESLA